MNFKHGKLDPQDPWATIRALETTVPAGQKVKWQYSRPPKPGELVCILPTLSGTLLVMPDFDAQILAALEAGGGEGKGDDPASVGRTPKTTREQAHKLALDYVEKNGWPDSQRKLADAVGVSRPLLADLPGIERYKRVPAPKAATQVEAERNGEPEGTEPDPVESLAHEEIQQGMLARMDKNQRKCFESFSDVGKARLTVEWGDATDKRKEELLASFTLGYEQAGEKAEAERPAKIRRRAVV